MLLLLDENRSPSVCAKKSISDISHTVGRVIQNTAKVPHSYKLFNYLVAELLKSPSIYGEPQIQFAYAYAMDYILDLINVSINKNLTLDDIFPNLKGLPTTHHWLKFCNQFPTYPEFFFEFIPQNNISGLPRNIWFNNACEKFKEIMSVSNW